MIEVNEVFLTRMKRILGVEYENFLHSLDNPSVKSIYVNQNKIDVGKFRNLVDFEISPIQYEKAGFYVDNIKLGRHPLHHAGAFYIQEPSAMFTVNTLRFKGNERVLDLCSAPGGKSIQIANRIPDGILVSNEIVKSRSEILYSNIERMGLKNVIITNDTTKNICEAYANSFDVVVADAPCSGEGMFRKGSDMIAAWNPSLNVMCATRQLDILDNANLALRQGGYLIYSTCTYSLEENEQVVREFLSKYNYELININASFDRGIDMPEAVRLYPHKVKGEGQFVALMKKLENNEDLPNKAMKLERSSKVSKFVMDLGIKIDSVVKYGKYTYNVLEESFIKSKVNYYTLGVRLGEMVGDRFEPHHNLFTAFGREFIRKIELDYLDIDTTKYLRGETLEIDSSEGFGAVIVNGCALGGYKISKGKFKNYYPKGIRNF